GQQFLGQITNVTTDSAGNASFTAVLPFTSLVGTVISSTATDPSGDTSEFSQVTVASSSLLVTNTNDRGQGSLRQAILDANSSPGQDTIPFAIPGGGAQTIAPLTLLPAITDPVIIDGYTQPGASPNTLAVGNNAAILVVLSGQNLPSGSSGL